MSYEPDTNDIRIRQLKEEIAKIREEQFSRAFPTNNVGSPSVINSDSGIPAPTIGVSSIIPAVIRITKDTGVIDLLKYKEVGGSDKNFIIGEVVTGQSSGATATIGDIDITVVDDSGTLTLVPSSITGTFTDDEGLIGNIDGDAKVDGTLFTQTGRGHLNAGAGSIIADGDNISPPLEIHFIDNAQQDGQVIYLRAQDGQTIRLRRPTTNDATTGNLDIDESFNLIENALVFFQYQVASNATPTGGWVPLITNVSAGVGGTGGAFSFPILYPKENLGTTSGVIDLALNQNDGHYKQVTLDGDASITFSNLPPTINGFKFYLLTIQDGTGGHVYTDLPNTVLFETALLSQLQTAPNAQTLWQFSTADGGLNWHASVIQSQGAGGDNLGNHKATEDLKMETFDIINLDVLKYADGTQPGADGIIGFGEWGSAVDNDSILKWSIPASTLGNSRGYEWQVDLAPVMKLNIDQFGNTNLDMLFNGSIDNTLGITFFHQVGTLSSITPGALELRYENGIIAGGGGFHGFHVAGEVNPQFEIREDVIRANKNLDMITNNIFDVDVVEWASTGGFLAGTNHGIRSIGGGNTGLEMNVPKDKTFRMLIENFGQTDSDIQYEFTQNEIFMNNNQIKDVLAVRFSNLTSFVDFGALNFEIIGGLQNANVADSDPQNMLFRIQQKVGFDTYVTRDVFTMTGSEFFIDGGMKMHTDLNMQTQNINNIDVAKFVQDGGEILDDEYAIGVDITGITFNFNVPLNKKYGFMEDNESIAFLDKTGLNLVSTPLFTDPAISAREFVISGVHTDGPPVTNGAFRLVGNDVIVFTGGQEVNLTTGGTSFIGFTADADLNMGTFNITGLDVLRFQVDGGVIGFGQYGISTDPFTMNFSTPSGLGYIFMDNLDPIAFLDEDQFQLLGNTGNADPSFIGREFIALAHSAGTIGLNNGGYRLVGTDVIIRSGGTNVNLTTLSAGGGDNLGNHKATQDLDMGTPSNIIINFSALTSTFGHSMLFNPFGMVWDLDSPTQAFSWTGNGVELMTLTNTGIDIQGGRIQNLANPSSPLDAVNLQTLNSGFVTTNTNQTTGLSGNKTWTGNHNFDGSAMVIGTSSSDIVQILSRVSGSLIPTGAGTNLGDTTRTWDVFASTLRFGTGFAVDDISTSPSATGNTELMTAQAIQIAISGGGSGTFVTTNTFQSVPADKTWTGIQTFLGSITAINSGAIFLGDTIADTLSITARVQGNFIPTIQGNQLGEASRRWSLKASDLEFSSGNTVSTISNSITAFGSSTLMTATAIQNAILAFGGGGGVQLGDSPLWTGNHIFNGSTTSINSSAIFLGNSTGDTLLMNARVQGNIIPTQDGNNLGDTSRRWDLFGQAMSLQFGNTVTNISNSSTQSSSSALMTANAIQNAISAGGGGVSLSDNPFWTGFHTFGQGAVFNSSVNIGGTLNHDGIRVGFYGTTPVTRSSGWFVSGGPDDRTLFVTSASTLEVAEVLGTLIRQLERVGIIT